MKKVISLIICVVLAVGLFASCMGGDDKANDNNSDKLRIVTTVFPIYDWVRNILGDKASDVELTMLLDDGVDLHSYQPTAQDIVKISACDLFIYVGGESDEWVEDALSEAANEDMKVINLVEALGDKVKEEEVKEGMEAEEDEDHEDHEEEKEYDEHVWLSLKNAAALTEMISAEILAKDPDNAQTYKANTDSYIEKLNALDKSYSRAVDSAEIKTLVFGDRFPFRYLVDDYDLDYYAAFVGCSAETEASFKTVVFLANKLDELGIDYVMQIESADGKLSQSVIDASQDKSREILTLDSMQSTTSKQVEEGADYISIMEKNLSILKTVLHSAA